MTETFRPRLNKEEVRILWLLLKAEETRQKKTKNPKIKTTRRLRKKFKKLAV